jgi:hypothetical protein
LWLNSLSISKALRKVSYKLLYPSEFQDVFFARFTGKGKNGRGAGFAEIAGGTVKLFRGIYIIMQPPAYPVKINDNGIAVFYPQGVLYPTPVGLNHRVAYLFYHAGFRAVFCP